MYMERYTREIYAAKYLQDDHHMISISKGQSNLI